LLCIGASIASALFARHIPLAFQAPFSPSLSLDGVGTLVGSHLGSGRRGHSRLRSFGAGFSFVLCFSCFDNSTLSDAEEGVRERKKRAGAREVFIFDSASFSLDGAQRLKGALAGQRPLPRFSLSQRVLPTVRRPPLCPSPSSAEKKQCAGEKAPLP